MARWEHYIKRADLSESQLAEIPGTTCESTYSQFEYCEHELGIPRDRLLEGLSVDEEYLKNPNNWISALDDVRLDRNIFAYADRKLTHKDFFHHGSRFRFSRNSAMSTLYSMIPVSRVLKEISRVVTHFNNYYEMKSVYSREGENHITLRPEPYFRRYNSGAACRYTEGVFASNFSLHNIRQFSIEHEYCSTELSHLAEHTLKRFGLHYEEQDGYAYIDGELIAERITLRDDGHPGAEVMGCTEAGFDREGNAWRITREVVRDGIPLFSTGEIYGAPYCYIRLRWKENNLIARLSERFRQLVASPRVLRNLQKSIEQANERFFEAREALEEARRTAEILQVYTRRSLLDRLRTGEDPRYIDPQELNRTVMFMDIREFTTMSEEMNSRDVVRFLNSFFDRMNFHIDQCDGEIDKLIGDCILASFPSADRGLDAATRMLTALQAYNRERLSYNHRKIITGTGISHGPVILGNIGSETKLDLTLVGNTVNLASRVEELCKVYHTRLLIDQHHYDALENKEHIRFIDIADIRGYSEPVKIYESYAFEPEDIRRKKAERSEQFREAWDHYRMGHVSAAARLYRGLIAEFGPHRYLEGFCADPVCDVFLSRCQNRQRRVH
jgi:adenylate cyclase